MKFIAATQLRTKMPELIETIRRGESVNLLYRSQVLAEIRPKKIETKAVKKKLTLSEFLSMIKPDPKTTHEQRDEIYRKHLMEKYG